ncbi:hypothetical protein CVU37_10355 [candidate division BRC1 bacterium HGW-BRC1-1]|nr:MAG: hypothetical protein CVU37_10355 [candidate division BRC1 bacterium HGW-BRC1-1]
MPKFRPAVRFVTVMVFLLVAAAVVGAALLPATPGKSDPRTPASPVRVAVTTSWLECVLRDLTPDGMLAITRLCPPGSCPGHFDMAPSAARELSEAAMVFLFDFQSAFADRLRGTSGADKSPSPVVLTGPGGMCVPDQYLAVSREVASALAENDVITSESAREGVDRVAARMKALGDDLRMRVKDAGLSGKPVAVAGHQKEFAEWLGLRPAVVFSGSDMQSPSAMESVILRAREAKVVLVVGNLQEGRQSADAVARAVGVPVVVFGNFPHLTAKEPNFDTLVKNNADALVTAAAAAKL